MWRSYSKLLLGGRAPHPISKRAPHHPNVRSVPFFTTVDRHNNHITVATALSSSQQGSKSLFSDLGGVNSHPSSFRLNLSLNRHLTVVEGFEHLSAMLSWVVMGKAYSRLRKRRIWAIVEPQIQEGQHGFHLGWFWFLIQKKHHV